MSTVGSGNFAGFHWSRKHVDDLVVQYLGFKPLGLSRIPWDVYRNIGMQIDMYNRDITILKEQLDLSIISDPETHRELIEKLFKSVERNFGVNFEKMIE